MNTGCAAALGRGDPFASNHLLWATFSRYDLRDPPARVDEPCSARRNVTPSSVRAEGAGVSARSNLSACAHPVSLRSRRRGASYPPVSSLSGLPGAAGDRAATFLGGPSFVRIPTVRGIRTPGCWCRRGRGVRSEALGIPERRSIERCARQNSGPGADMLR